MAFTTSPPWYANGTVATDGTTKITGTATSWTDVGKIALGDMITLDGSTFYQIQQIGDGSAKGTGTAVNDPQTTYNEAVGGNAAANNTIIIVDRTIPTGTGQSYSILQFSAINPANSDIAYKVSAMVQAWQGREDELRAWLAGSSGTFPLTDATGVTYQVKSPAQMQADVDNTIASALSSKNTPGGVVSMDHKSRVSTNGYLIPAVDSALPISSIVDHDFFDNTQDAAWIDRCADKSWETEHIALGRQYLAVSYANDAAALAANPSIVNGDVYYTGSVFNEYGVGMTTRAGSRKFPMRGLVTAEAGRVIIWDITSGQVEMWRVRTVTGALSITTDGGHIAIGSSAGVYYEDYPADKIDLAVSYSTTTAPAIVNNTVNSVAMTYLPYAPLDAYEMRVPTGLVGTAAGGSWVLDSGTVYDATGAIAIIASDIDSLGRTLLASASKVYVFNTIPTADIALTAADHIFDTAGTVGAHIDGAITSVIWARDVIIVGTSTGLFEISYNQTTPASSILSKTTSAFSTGGEVGDIQACLVATATNTVADKSVKGIALTSTTLITTAVATSATLLSFKDTGGSITATLGATVANGHITWWEKVGTVWHHYVSVISAAGASTATGYIDGVSSTAVPIVNVAVAGGTGLTILTNIEVTQVRPSVTVSTPEQIKHMYETERKLFEPNAQALLSNSVSVSDLRYDKKSGMYAVTNGTNTDLFKDLVRVDSAATGASIATPVTTLSGNRVLAPAVDIGSELAAQVKPDKYSIIKAIAADVTNTPAGNIVATDVQAAINELDAEKLTVTHGSDTANPHGVTIAQVNGEPSLGNPSSDGQVLSSTAAGVRGWITPAAGGDMLAANNLSDVANATTARANLGITHSVTTIEVVSNAATITTANALTGIVVLTGTLTAHAIISIVSDIPDYIIIDQTTGAFDIRLQDGYDLTFGTYAVMVKNSASVIIRSTAGADPRSGMQNLHPAFDGTITTKGITESSPTPNTATIDLAVGTVFNYTAATAITLPAVAAGKSFTVVSSVAIPSTNWTGTIQWAGGAAPTPAVGGCVFVFVANADATAWIGTQSIDGAA